MFSLLFSFCFCGKDLSSFSCIFSSFNIFFFVSDKKKKNSMVLQQVNFWDNQERSRALSVEARKEAREEYKKWVLMESLFFYGFQ